jgi:hypothetical protein
MEQLGFDLGYAFDEPTTSKGGGMRIVQADFVSAKHKTFEEIFYNGKYDTLHAITFSSSFELIYEATKRFKYTEIIFGDQHAINKTMQFIMASQIHTVDVLKKDKRCDEVLQFIREGRLKLYLFQGYVSHAKMYLLSGENGASNVIIGSSNFSYPAWKSAQREINIEMPNNQEAFEYGMSVYSEIKRQSSTQLDIERIKKDQDTSLKETPIIAVIEVEKEVRVPVYTKEDLEEFEFAKNREDFIINQAEHIERFLPKPKVTKGVATYRIDAIQKALMDVAADVKEDEKVKKETPRLEVDLDEEKISFMGADFPSFVEEQSPTATIKSDLENLSSYMASFDSFIGNSDETRNAVWTFLCYSFASPFMCRLRKCASKNGYTINAYPMFALIYGAPSTSKTSMTKIVRMMMIGRTGNDLGIYPSHYFKKTMITDSLRLTQVGFPIFIDDLSDSQYARHVENVIKDETFESRYTKIDSPVVVMTTNRVRAISKDISKRCLCIRPDSQVTQDAMLLNAKEFNDFCDSFSPRLFLRYLEKMIPRVREMMRLMEEKEVSIAPDILSVSSNVLMEICREELGSTPYYMKELNFINDAFGEEPIGKKKVAELREYFSLNPEMFEFRGKKVFVRFEKTKDATEYFQELPRYACVGQNNNYIICNAKRLKEYGIKKPSLFDKLFS